MTTSREKSGQRSEVWRVGAYASPNGARRYVSFERVWRRAERERRRFEREKPVVRIV